MKDFDKDGQKYATDKNHYTPAIKKEVLPILCVLTVTLGEYGATEPHRQQGPVNSAYSAVNSCAVQAARPAAVRH